MTAPTELTDAELLLCGDMARDGIAFARRHAALLAENARLTHRIEIVTPAALAGIASVHDIAELNADALQEREQAQRAEFRLSELHADAMRMVDVAEAKLAVSLERERVLREEVGRLTGKLCLICGRKEPCSESPYACTFDPHPIAAAQSFLKRANQAESSLAALRADAERFQWLKENSVGYAMHMGAVLYTPELVVPRNMKSAEIDAAIDAAIAKGGAGSAKL